MYSFKNEEFEIITNSLSQLVDRLNDFQTSPSTTVLTNKELCNRLNVCPKTLQKWRDNRLLAFSKVGRGIYYIWSDVLEMLDNNRTKGNNAA